MKIENYLSGTSDPLFATIYQFVENLENFLSKQTRTNLNYNFKAPDILQKNKKKIQVKWNFGKFPLLSVNFSF